jgi:hypothetical protein
MRPSVFPRFTDSIFKQPAFAALRRASGRASSPVFFAAPGTPSFFSLPRTKVRGYGAPSGATIVMCAHPTEVCGASRRSICGDFFVPGTVTSVCATRDCVPLHPGGFRLPSSAPVQPLKAAGRRAGGRFPEASRERGYEPRPQAPHRRCRVTPVSALSVAPSSERLATTPSGEPGGRTISIGVYSGQEPVRNAAARMACRAIWPYILRVATGGYQCFASASSQPQVCSRQPL